MMDSLRTLADRLAEAALTLAEVRPDVHDPGSAAWGGDPVGGIGDVTEELRVQLAAVLHARCREAGTAATRLSQLAADLRAVADGHRDLDEAARRRVGGLDREPS